ncbi:uncharacterized protein K489DRAFT_125234 [Dissoconium aciculare CBS 342.82]|uniref:Uncharacterized protein n=1 Tax=Dissoconium aciculare CBS 342.82 TaxID=1314786 RepID=A0A6J3MFI9_9PEZI|nr:uncharacterized protein K489DRAFT_125234 [Dissoconium aciculare CBS 342.82]KAF1826776.1 hypothetical protein K489DRAFT_125234 [Dissoconium aciculare CBS 342.82]
MTLYSSELHSVCSSSWHSEAVPYNFADFDGPLPASAWNCQPWCHDGRVPWVDILENYSYTWLMDGDRGPWHIAPQFGANRGICADGIIVEEFYRPRIMLPLQLRAAHPAWATCRLDLDGVFDPPIVLTAEATAAAATLAASLQTTAANPAPGIPTSLTPAKATAAVPAPAASLTSSQQVIQFTFDPSSDSPRPTAASDKGKFTDANAPITISAIVIPQLEQPPASTAPGLAAAPANSKSPSPIADSIPATSANGPANGNGPSNINFPANGNRPPNDDGPANGNGLPNGNGATNGQSPDSVTAFAIGSQTARPGGPAVTASGTTFSALPSGAGVQVIVSGLTSTIGLAAPEIAAPSSQAGNILIGSQTLLPGGQAVTQAGTIWSALPSGSGVQVVADGKTSTVTPQAPGIAALSSQPGNILIGLQTLVPGGPAVTQAGTIWSALPSGSGVQIVANGHTSTVIPQAPRITAAASLKADILIGSQTLTPGGPAITSAGTTWSALPSGSGVRIIVNGHTSTIAPVALAIAPAPVSTSNSGAGVRPSTAPVTNNSTSPTTSGLALYPVGPTSQSAWTIGGNHVITEGQAWTANGTIFSDISGTLFTGLASSSISTALATAIKQGAAVQIRDFSWGSGLAAGFSVLSGVLAVFL